jgi:tetratricopeptide (TPR) repeat protein
MDPREAYIFDWGAELLLHHAPEPALEVFGRGNRLFPDSIRMLVGLGAALFAGGSYEQAVQRICEASDLDPKNPVPYLFLGKIDRAESPRSDALVDRLRRFAEVHPESAEANYYYAVSLWNRRTTADGTAAQVESLLNIALRLDTQFAAAYLQLGIVYSAQRQFPEAIQDYQRAIKWAPQMEEAHYRLAQAYRQVGETEKARTEIDIYGKMAKQSSEEAERERHEIRQFVYTLRDRPPKQTQ